jgi:hypothetical protein
MSGWNNPYTTGTISIGAGATSVVGVGTFWTPLSDQSLLLITKNLATVVSAVVDDTHLTIPAWAAAAVAAGTSYQLATVPASASVSGVVDLLAKLAQQGVIYTVTGSSPDNAFGNDGDFAFKFNAGLFKVWQKAAGIWVLQAGPFTAIADASIAPVKLDAGTDAKQERFREALWAAPAESTRNILINGGMEVSQAAETAALTISASPSFPVDCFRAALGGTMVATGQQVSSGGPVGFRRALKVKITTAQAVLGTGDSLTVTQRVEGTEIARAMFGTATPATLTLSFLVMVDDAAALGLYSVAFRNSANDRTYVGTYTINAVNVWEYKTITLVADSSGTWLSGAAIGLRVSWGLAVGSALLTTAGAWGAGNFSGAAGQVNLAATLNASWYMTGAVLRIGGQVIPSAKAMHLLRPYIEEFRRCIRYYRKSFPFLTAPAQNAGSTGALRATQIVGASASQLLPPVVFETPMVATPTVTLFNPFAANGEIRNTTLNSDWSGSGTSGLNSGGFHITGTSPGGSAAGNVAAVHWAADANL